VEHFLKIALPWFAAVASGAKTVELRRDDRGYSVGDTLVLCEWDGSGETGRVCPVVVTHVLRPDDVPDLLPPGVVALSIQREGMLLRGGAYDAPVERTTTFRGIWSGDGECGCWAVRPADYPPGLVHPLLQRANPFHRRHLNLYPDALVRAVLATTPDGGDNGRGRWTITVRFEPEAAGAEAPE